MDVLAVVFDMDGVLVDSEPAWQIAEREVAGELGVPLSDADLASTRGLRMVEVAGRWFARSPWVGPSVEAVAADVTARVAAHMASASPMRGVLHALSVVEARDLRVALCSSSSYPLIHAILDALGLRGRFEVVHSADDDPHGKPHPAPYLSTARALGVDPSACVAIEDSVNGAISARAAGMRVIAVPERWPDVRFGFADAVLDSLEAVDDDLFDDLSRGVVVPSLARPRFHLAFPVDDLDAARTFYAGVLGCAVGRSAETWIDFDLFGHQVVAHVDPRRREVAENPVDGHAVPAEHFGVLLSMPAWSALVARLRSAGVDWVMEPTVRFAGLPGEQATFFVRDPAGNALEFKAFRDDRRVFAVTSGGQGASSA